MFDPAFLRTLESLSFVAKQALRSTFKGERRSVSRGASVEFSEHRSYLPGDDLRYLDWNAYGRLDKLFLKLFREQVDLPVHLLLDVSRSMGVSSNGRPPKLEYAKRLAAALGYVALSNLERVAIGAFNQKIQNVFPLGRGQHRALALFQFLDTLHPDEATNLTQSVNQYLARVKQAGVTVIISDFFEADPGGSFQALKRLLYHQHEVCVLHVLDPEDHVPGLTGDLKLIDAETGHAIEVSMNAALLTQYHKTFTAFCARLNDFCLRHHMTYVAVDTSIPAEDFVLQVLRLRGVLQ